MMDNSRIALFVVITVLAIGAWRLFNPSTTFAADGADPTWDQAVERSQSTGRPGLVLVTAGWCGACQWLHAEVLSRSDVQLAIRGHYTMYTLDMSHPTARQIDRSRKLGVNAYPTLIRYDAEGHETARTHAMDPQSMIQWLKTDE